LSVAKSNEGVGGLASERDRAWVASTIGLVARVAALPGLVARAGLVVRR
jgi:hypothetical protein